MFRKTAQFVENLDLTKFEKAIKAELEYAYIYLLYNEDELVYVGQTTQYPIHRILDHVKQAKKIFTHYSLIEIPEGIDLKLVEELLIARHNPLYNKDGKYIKKQIEIAKILGIPKEEAMSFEIRIVPNSKIRPQQDQYYWPNGVNK